MQLQLVDAARKAGMSEIATGILHNLGNLMNSITTSSQELMSICKSSRVPSFKQS